MFFLKETVVLERFLKKKEGFAISTPRKNQEIQEFSSVKQRKSLSLYSKQKYVDAELIKEMVGCKTARFSQNTENPLFFDEILKDWPCYKKKSLSKNSFIETKLLINRTSQYKIALKREKREKVKTKHNLQRKNDETIRILACLKRNKGFFMEPNVQKVANNLLLKKQMIYVIIKAFNLENIIKTFFSMIHHKEQNNIKAFIEKRAKNTINRYFYSIKVHSPLSIKLKSFFR